MITIKSITIKNVLYKAKIGVLDHYHSLAFLIQVMMLKLSFDRLKTSIKLTWSCATRDAPSLCINYSNLYHPNILSLLSWL